MYINSTQKIEAKKISVSQETANDSIDEDASGVVVEIIGNNPSSLERFWSHAILLQVFKLAVYLLSPVTTDFDFKRGAFTLSCNIGSLNTDTQ